MLRCRMHDQEGNVEDLEESVQPLQKVFILLVFYPAYVKKQLQPWIEGRKVHSGQSGGEKALLMERPRKSGKARIVDMCCFYEVYKVNMIFSIVGAGGQGTSSCERCAPDVQFVARETTVNCNPLKLPGDSGEE